MINSIKLTLSVNLNNSSNAAIILQYFLKMWVLEYKLVIIANECFIATLWFAELQSRLELRFIYVWSDNTM